MRRLAEWVATQDLTPDPKALYRAAVGFIGFALPESWIPLVLEREDWRTYRDQMALDDNLRARKALEHHYGAYVAAHRWALEAATSVGDYKTAAEIASPVLDRVAPKRDQNASVGQTVIIKLSQGSPLIQTEPIEVEVLPVEQSE